MSYVDRDKLSLPEVLGHLRDHCDVKEGTMLHWLFPRRDMRTGQRALVDDQVCQYMSNCIGEDGVADVYVEKHEIVPVREQDATYEGSGYEEEMGDNSEDDDIDEDLPPLVVRKSESKEVDTQVALVR